MATAWQSYLGMLAQVKGGGVEKYWKDSEVYRCRGGNQQLATKLVAAIGRFCEGWNERCQPLCWTKDAEQLLATLERPTGSG